MTDDITLRDLLTLLERLPQAIADTEARLQRVAAVQRDEALRYPVDRAAHLLGLSPSTLQRRIKAGALPAVRDGGQVFVLRADLERYAAGETGEQAQPLPDVRAVFNLDDKRRRQVAR